VTIDQFLEELDQIKDFYDWTIYHNAIRGVIKNLGRKPIYAEDFSCPITAVAHAQNYYADVGEFKEAGQFMGLKLGDILDIMLAADINKDSNLRKKMIKILDLNEARAQRA
jgi:hypothetical protein